MNMTSLKVGVLS